MGINNIKHPLDFAGKYIHIKATQSQKQAIDDEFGKKLAQK